jgi:catechol 2,3-dioxygenase-like lactoylglutathione lyase family enzyme
MPVIGYDHVALPAGDPEAILAFYKKLGFGTIHEEEWRAGDYPLFAIQIGENAKLNFHGPALWQDASFEAKGPTAKPGCGDLCFLFEGTIDEAVELIQSAGGKIAYGPFDQPGGGDRGKRLGTSVYTRDPDGNLIEFMTYPASGHTSWQGEEMNA